MFADFENADDKKELLDTREGDELLEERIIDSEPVFKGGFLNVEAVNIMLPDGNRTVHEVVRHPGAVAVVALNENGEVLLVRQYRTALERVTVEIPAGKLERGEDPLRAAQRELQEETGYTAGRMDYLMPVAVAAGYSDEIIHLYMATELTAGQAHPDEDEFVAAEWVALDKLVDSVLDARIEDSKTVIAALICDAMRHRI